MREKTQKIKGVRKSEDGYDVLLSDGWSVWVRSKYGVEPKKGDSITIFGDPHIHIQGIAVNGKVLYKQSGKEMNEEHHNWVEATKKKYEQEYLELMKEIKDEEPFETVDISGFGGGYEKACQMMLRAGRRFLENCPSWKWDYETSPGVYGVCTSQSANSKLLDKAMSKAVNDDYSGAMHQAVIGHLRYISEHGYESWLRVFPRSRRYMYPSGLPKPSFGSKTS